VAATGNADEVRPGGKIGAVRSRMRVRRLANSTVQAINRVQCRRAVDAEGNCDPTDVYLLLPPNAEGKEILDLLIEQMPDVQVEEWVLPEDVPGARKPNFRGGLGQVIKQMEPGEVVGLTDVRRRLGCKGRRMQELAKEILDDETDLGRLAASLGVTYEKGSGRRQGRLVRSQRSGRVA